MKKFLILSVLMFACACVGQRDDPEDIPPDGPASADTVEVGTGRCLVLDFTGTWCVNCPRMEKAIEDAMQQRPGQIVPVSVHCLSLDPMAPMPLSSDLASRFGVSAYPSVVVDLDKSSLFSTTSAELLLARCDGSLKARGKSSELSVSGSGGAVTVLATAATEGNYSLHILVVEDGIVAAQTGGSEQHVHNNVLRQWIEGETVSGVPAGKELSFTANVEAGPGRRVVALVCREGRVDNVASAYL